MLLIATVCMYVSMCVCVCVCVYIYIYVYIYCPYDSDSGRTCGTRCVHIICRFLCVRGVCTSYADSCVCAVSFRSSRHVKSCGMMCCFVSSIHIYTNLNIAFV